jgi:hypothetical protein
MTSPRAAQAAREGGGLLPPCGRTESPRGDNITSEYHTRSTRPLQALGTCGCEGPERGFLATEEPGRASCQLALRQSRQAGTLPNDDTWRVTPFFRDSQLEAGFFS